MALSRERKRAREQILTQPEPAKIRKSTDAVVLKAGGLLLVATEGGEVPFDLPHAYGLFYRDCRFLDGYTLRLDGREPVVLGGTAERSVETRHRLTNEALPAKGKRAGVPKNTLALERERFVRGGVIHELIAMRNHGRRAARFSLDLAFRAQFEDLFIVKGFVKGPRGRLDEPRVVDDARVELAYEGRDRRRRATVLAFCPRPDTLGRAPRGVRPRARAGRSPRDLGGDPARDHGRRGHP